MILNLSKVGGKFGAPMGREPTMPDDANAAIHLFIVSLTFVDGDYDQGGAYWGFVEGEPVYCAYNEDTEVFVRAKDQSQAEEEIRNIFPNATFSAGSEFIDDLGEECGEFARGYLKAALYSSVDDDGIPLDESYSFADFSKECKVRLLSDAAKFLEENEQVLADYAIQENAPINEVLRNAGMDFWLTRNGHGSGFWDGGWPDEIGKKLTKESKKFGEINLYVGDDGKIYC